MLWCFYIAEVKHKFYCIADYHITFYTKVVFTEWETLKKAPKQSLRAKEHVSIGSNFYEREIIPSVYYRDS